MNQRPHQRVPGFCASLLIVLAGVHAPAPRAQQARLASTPTHTTSLPRPDAPGPTTTPAPASPTAAIQLRVYDDFPRPGPVDGRRDTPMAIDVTAGIRTCLDGNTEITTMNIGGWLYEVPGACAGENQRGSLHVGQSLSPAAAAATPPAPTAGPTVMRCDPATWRCTSTPR